MLLGALGASLLGNLFASKGIVRAKYGNKGKKQGDGIVRSCYGSKIDFQCHLIH